MKKLFSFLLLFTSLFCQAQTATEIGHILEGTATDLFSIGAATQNTLGNNMFNEVAGAASTNVISGGPISYRSFNCQIVASAGISAGAIIFEGGNDSTNYTPLTVYDDAAVTGTPIIAAVTIAANTRRYFSGKVMYKFIRCRISTAFTGGTIQAFTRFSPYDYTPRITTVGNPTTGNLLTTATISGTPTYQEVTGTTNSSTSTALNSAATTNATALKASAGLVYTLAAHNTTATTKYIRLYNKATAPTVGTDIPVWVIAIPAISSKEIVFDVGLKFATGIGYAITGGATATDATAVAAGDVQLLINWQ